MPARDTPYEARFLAIYFDKIYPGTYTSNANFIGASVMHSTMKIINHVQPFPEPERIKI